MKQINLSLFMFAVYLIFILSCDNEEKNTNDIYITNLATTGEFKWLNDSIPLFIGQYIKAYPSNHPIKLDIVKQNIDTTRVIIQNLTYLKNFKLEIEKSPKLLYTKIGNKFIIVDSPINDVFNKKTFTNLNYSQLDGESPIWEILILNDTIVYNKSFSPIFNYWIKFLPPERKRSQNW